MNNFKFEVGQIVNITLLDTVGEIIDRSDLGGGVIHYELKYSLTNDDGKIIHPIAWWSESSLDPISKKMTIENQIAPNYNHPNSTYYPYTYSDSLLAWIA